MTASDLTRVIFFQVHDAATKCSHLAKTAQFHFSRKEKLLILVEDDRALNYVDELLWTFPKESFLPHSVQSDDWISLTKSKNNLNQARFAFNLCPTPNLIEGFRIIYDFEDMSSSNKKILSQLRFDAYKQAHFLIESRS